MIDLSNNNAAGHNFRVAHHTGGQSRLYLKLGEDVSYTDRTFRGLRTRAQRAGFKVGAYWFCHPLAATPAETAQRILGLLPPFRHDGRELRVCLDLEYGSPSPAAGRWATEVARRLHAETGQATAFYGSGWYLQGLAFAKPPGPLWLAAYGRNDGRLYPVGRLPSPWRVLAAQQYSSAGHVVGINGRVDVSHVYRPRLLDVPRCS